LTAPRDQAGATDAGGVERAQANARPLSSRGGVLMRVLKWATIVVVLAAVVWQFRKLATDWAGDGAAVIERGVAWPWLVGALVVYACGQFCFALYWRRLLRATGIEAPPIQAIRAYLVGTLGKYVPGKALVIVVRAGMLPSGQGRRLVVAGVTIYETLTSMAAAGLIACIALTLTKSTLVNNILGAVAIAVVLNFGVIPPVFARISRWVALPFGRDSSNLPYGDWYRCYWRSTPLWICEWLGAGLSLWATAAAFHLDVWSWGAVVYMTGVAALGTAAGFIVLPVPAGIGVREFIIILLLEKWFAGHVAGAHATAVAVSLMLRTVWTVGEMLIAGGLYALPGVSWAGARAAEIAGVSREPVEADRAE